MYLEVDLFSLETGLSSSCLASEWVDICFMFFTFTILFHYKKVYLDKTPKLALAKFNPLVISLIFYNLSSHWKVKNSYFNKNITTIYLLLFNENKA